MSNAPEPTGSPQGEDEGGYPEILWKWLKFIGVTLLTLFLIAPLTLGLIGGNFSLADVLAMTVIILGLWYGVPRVLRSKRAHRV